MKRKIERETVQLFDKLLKDNALAQECMSKKQQPRQLFVEVAKACLGITESPGNRGSEVDLFQKTVRNSVGDQWCMAFLQSCIAYVEEKINVKSPLYGDGTCMTVWDGTPKEQRVKELPLAGAVAIWQHTEDKDHGHTGMVLDCDGDSFHAIEGNTHAGFVDINAKVGQTGDGVGFTQRRYDLHKPQSGDMQLLGCLKPFLAESQDVQLGGTHVNQSISTGGQMSHRIYVACRQAISEEHGTPPNSFLDQLIDAINPLPDEVFAKNDHHDIYSVMLGSLGPYTSLLHRKAVMCEVMRVQAAFESDWNWNAGVDTNNENSMHHKEGEETGAFQVSWDSMEFDDSLRECMDRLAGAHDVLSFIEKMKSNHPLAVEYCARLLRFNTTWCGTIKDPKMVIDHVRRDAVAEFQTFLTVGQNT